MSESHEGGLLNGIVSFSLRFRGVVIALSFGFLGYGIFSLAKAKYDVFPEFAVPQIVIQTQASGLSPEQVETLVTLPVENSLNGVAGIDSMHSNSIQGLSVITLTFDAASDIYKDRQVVAERLSTLSGNLPQGVQAPVMVPLTSSTGDLLTVGITSTEHSLMDLRVLADWTLKPRLLAVPGVAKVAIFGGDIRQFQIQIDPEKLKQYGLSVDDVISISRRITGVRGAGFIDTGNQRIIVQTQGQFTSPEKLAKTVFTVSAQGNVTLSLKLGDVAQVVEAPEPPISAASVMGKPGVVLNIWAQYGANTLEVTENLEKAINELKPDLEKQKIEIVPDLFRAATFINKASLNLRNSLWIGAILVIVVLFIFLMDFKTAAISVTAIPLSLLAAVAVMQHLGLSLNTMTLGGLAIAIGEVVDDAVIDVENILRRIRENAKRPKPKPLFQVVLDASMEVRTAVVYATFAVILVFIPVLTMSGLAGRLFGPLGVAYIFAILSSLVVALTLTPALSFMFLGGKTADHADPVLVQKLKENYRRILLLVEKYPKAVIRTVLVFTLMGIGILPFMKGEFLPEFREGHFLIHMLAVPGTSIEESLRIGNRVSEELLKQPYVRSVAQRVGRSEVDDTFGPQSSEFELDLKPLSSKEAGEVEDQIRDVLKKFVGVSFSINTFLTERMEETLSGFTAPVVINLVGQDLDILDQKTKETTALLSKIPGAVDITVQAPPGTPQLSVNLRSDDLEKWGFNAVDVLEVVRTAFQGNVIGQVYEKNQIFNVSVILEPSLRKNLAAVKGLLLKNPAGIYVKLEQLAEIEQTSGRYGVLHSGGRRVQTITCNLKGRDLKSFIREAKEKIKTLSLPAGMYFEWGGTAEAQARSTHDLILHSVLAGLGIIVLLSIVLGHTRNVLLVLVNLPFAFAGGVLVVFILRQPVSIGVLVGFVTLFGITLRNSIMMISHYDHLVNVEGCVWDMETAIRGASERLVPILMTALVTALGLLPLALGSGTAGREIEGPMALVILGGLATSTALNLLVLPTLALRYGKFTQQKNGEIGIEDKTVLSNHRRI